MTASPDKIKACLRGAVTADAATMGTHWIYDPEELKEQVKETPDTPEFFTPPKPRYYSEEEFPGHYQAGMPSPYGELLLFGINYCAENAGNPIDAAAMLEAKYKWATTYGGRQDHALKTVLEAVEKADKDFTKPCGADDHQAMTYMKAVPVASMFAGKPELLENVETAVRVHQDNDVAVQFGQAAAMLIEFFLLDKGTSVREAVNELKSKMAPDVIKAIDEVIEAVDNVDATLETILSNAGGEMPAPYKGRTCQLPDSFSVPLFIMLREEAKGASGDETFIGALRENIWAAGDNCSRSVFLGAVLGARNGSVPAELLEKVDKDTIEKVDKDINAIIEA